MSTQQALFNERSLEQLVGKGMLQDSKTAIIELIANSWDAGADRVDIIWPETFEDKPFSILDNGIGMSKDQFSKRWVQVSYNRQAEQGPMVIFPADTNNKTPRKAFGRNGLGRNSAFCFSKPYFVATSNGEGVHSYKVNTSNSNLFEVEDISNEVKINTHGTMIYSKEIKPAKLNLEDLKKEIGMRFLTDPTFNVYVNGQRVSFIDVPDTNKQKLKATVDGHEIEIIAIDIQDTDKTTYQHGVAWHVNSRLVGECSWKGPNAAYALDGRKTAAKRFTFIVKANYLDQEGFILPDWSGFTPKNETVKRAFDAVHEVIKNFILALSKEERKEAFEKIKSSANNSLKNLGLEDLEIWEVFVKKVQEECPSIGDNELEQVAKILANLEASKSKYALLHKLGTLDSNNLDELDQLLGDWSLQMAKAVLDEIQQRLALIDELTLKVNNDKTDEVKELQPLFNRSLWIFGPEYETIEYTSNKGMTTVIRDLMNSNERGSQNRPDFVVLPDGSCSLFTLPRYDYDNGGMENGVDRVVILELKKPSVPIAQAEKNQPLKYIAELDEKGLTDRGTKINCFVLGKRINQHLTGKSTEQDGRITIYPMTYEAILRNAHARLFNLHEKVKTAPFLNKKEVEEFIARGEDARAQNEMNI